MGEKLSYDKVGSKIKELVLENYAFQDADDEWIAKKSPHQRIRFDNRIISLRKLIWLLFRSSESGYVKTVSKKSNSVDAKFLYIGRFDLANHHLAEE